MGNIATAILAFIIVIILVLARIFIYPSLVRKNIQANGTKAIAVLLDSRYTAGIVRSGNTVISKHYSLTLEIHSDNGSVYTVVEKTWVPSKYLDRLIPGSRMEVLISTSNPKQVVSLLETIQPPAGYADKNATDPQATLEKLKRMLSAGLITQEDYDQTKKAILSEMVSKQSA